jgi:carbon-monoxide dehydrogenase small subunit
MIMSARALLDETPRPDEDEIRNAIAGNICRCTGYVQIIDAIRAAGKSPADDVRVMAWQSENDNSEVK